MDVEFPFCNKKTFWISVSEKSVYTLLKYKNGFDGKFYVKCFYHN